MIKSDALSFKKLLPVIVALAVFFLIIIIYFYPVLEGKKLSASDMVHFKGMSKEVVDYRDKTGEEALWTNGMFGGMPAYQISVHYTQNLMTYIHRLLRLGFHLPVGMIIIYFIGFYILMRVLKINPWLSITGAIAFAFSSYFFIILEAGHTSKAYAIGYMAPVFAGIILSYRGRWLAGGLTTAFFLALLIVSGHPQITYYLLIAMLIYGLVELIRHYREKKLPDFLKATGVLVLAALLAVLTHTASLWNVYEYSKYSIRGKTELTSEQENRTSGLDKDYATAWSYGISETMTLLIPNFHGGSSHGELSKNSETYQVLTQNRVPNADQIIKALPLYWGDQPFTSGPVYVGAIIVFLFVFSLIYLKGPLKWWGIAVTVLSIMLAWGKNFMPLTDFFLDYVPLYNKFRAVSMTLVIAELSIPLLALVALDQLLKDPAKEKAVKSLFMALYIVGGLLVFFLLLGTSLFSFSSPNDASQGIPDWLMPALESDRKALFRNDVVRSLIFVLLAFGLLWAYLKGKAKLAYVLALLPLFVIVDMWPVNKRYLNNDDFIKKNKVDNPYQATPADIAILKDKDLSYRVYNMNEAFDASARTSYFHKNIGGYHGAKMRRYQEVVDHALMDERRNIAEALGNSQVAPGEAMAGATAFNMLNTRYLILNANSEPLKNPYACGNAWFVGDYKIVANADEEIASLNGLDPARTAVIDKRFESFVAGLRPSAGPSGSIDLLSYSPDQLVYEYDAPADQLAVFSEIYYDKGWNAYLDGKKSPHFRANFILRAMVLPAGQHKLEFRFEPKSYYLGGNISLASSLIILLLIAGYFAKEFFINRKNA
ncbi:MAG: hypothetical protein KBC43_06910 [Bacteroidales bacterium]|nr:hypothetical protein [Bacteroidales bacterium]